MTERQLRYQKRLGSILCAICLLCFNISEGGAQDILVTDSMVFQDTTILLAGNLIVASGGALVIDSVELRMDCSFNGEYRIEVEPGGSLYIYRNSLITSENPESRFAFSVHGKIFEMRCSTLQGAGWGEEDEMNNDQELVISGSKGLVVTSDSAVIEKNTFSGNHVGLIVAGTHALVNDNKFYGQHAQALFIRDARSVRVTGNYLKNDHGSAALHITSDYDSRYVNNVIISDHGHALVTGSSHRCVFEENTFQSELISFFMIGGGFDNLIANNIIKTSEVGLHLWGWRNVARDNTIECQGPWMGTGIYMLFSYNCILENNTLSRMNEENGIWLLHSSNNLISNNRIEAAADLHGSHSSGILLYESSKHNLVQNNQVKGFHRGISVFYSGDHNILYNNSVSDGVYRGLIIDDSDSCIIYANNSISEHPFPDFDNGTNFYDVTGDPPEWIRAPDQEFIIGYDTYISEEVLIEDQVTDLESTFVNKGGVLTLKNCTFRTGINGSTGLGAEEGGKIFIYDCRFLLDDYGGGFELAPLKGSRLIMKDSEILGGGFEWWYGGPMLDADSILLERNLIQETTMNIRGSKGAVFRDNVFRNMYAAFILHNQPSDIRFEGNIFDGAYMAGVSGPGDRMTFSGNRYKDIWGPGLNLFCEGSYVVEADTFSHVHEPCFALNICGDSSQVQNSVIRDSYGGIYAGGSGLYGNLVETCVTGIIIQGTDSLESNWIKDCRTGLWVSSGRNQVDGNVFQSCDTGVYIEPGNPDNLFFQNDFIHNTVQASDLSGADWHNGERGNFWSDYVGFDQDGDGIGEDPYKIQPDVLDHYPLVRSISFQPVYLKAEARINPLFPDTISINSMDQAIVSIDVSRSLPDSSGVLKWKGLWLTLQGNVAEEGIIEVSLYKDLNENSTLDSLDSKIGAGQFHNGVARIIFDEIDTLETETKYYLLAARLKDNYALPGAQISVCLTDSSTFLCDFPGIILPDPAAYCTDPILIAGPSGAKVMKSNILSEVYPNPANESCIIRYSLHQQARVQLKLVNSAGKLEYISESMRMIPGDHELVVDVSSLTPGLYCCILQMGETHCINRVIIQH